jgi:hypothetical protein
MAQYLADLKQRSTLPQHPASQCMPELMRSLVGRLYSGPRESASDD